jgi:hypothetical protein
MDANDKLNGRRNFLRKTVTLIPLGTLTACDQQATTPKGATSGSTVDQAQTPAAEAPYRARFFDAGRKYDIETPSGPMFWVGLIALDSGWSTNAA